MLTKMTKEYQFFEINRNIYFKCIALGRYGQREVAELNINNAVISTGKYTWSNRPWQSFTFASAMDQAINDADVSIHYRRLIEKWIDNGGKREAKRIGREFKTVAMVASLGDIFGKTKKQSNDWKTRMLKAGLENKGFIMPDDWDELSEDEKTKRLDKVIKHLRGEE